MAVPKVNRKKVTECLPGLLLWASMIAVVSLQVFIVFAPLTH